MTYIDTRHAGRSRHQFAMRGKRLASSRSVTCKKKLAAECDRGDGTLYAFCRLSVKAYLACECQGRGAQLVGVAHCTHR
jgi:hypothetical protein